MISKNSLYLIIFAFIISIFVLNSFFILFSYNKNDQKSSREVYNPTINPSDFTSKVKNNYFTLIPGKKMVYEAETEEGKERIEVYVMHETKTVMGIEAAIVWDRVWLEEELIEDTKDWYAQDKEGDVWYLGEDSIELFDGKVVSHAGSWESGVDGAKPGIIMKANSLVGESYRQEYYKGEAEDMAEVLALDETVAVPYGTFNGCLKIKDLNLLKPGEVEHKYYCSEVGGVVLEAGLKNGEKTELANVEYNAKPSSSTVKEKLELKREITEQEAKQIALQKIKGKVTDITIEKKYGKAAYVIEIDSDYGAETDVIIDIETGEIIGIEE